jgi:hypothetical protein
MFSVSLVLFGGLGLFLGNLVLLVVCSGINDHFYASPQPSMEASPLRTTPGQFTVSELATN